ncbi:dCTP deaminase, dUMP-forming [subsurface metagenome]
MSVLTNREIREYLSRSEDPLVIMPLIEPRRQCKTNSVDVRLGFDFILFRKAELSTLDLTDVKLREKIGRYYERVYVGYDQPFMLHPRELVLGGTLEYLRIPKDLTVYITGRSTWGRLGLIIATATLIHPGFKGCPTLELVNHGNIPIQLFPRWPIAQLSFHRLSEPEKAYYQGKYSAWVGPTSPEFSKVSGEQAEQSWLIETQTE